MSRETKPHAMLMSSGSSPGGSPRYKKPSGIVSSARDEEGSDLFIDLTRRSHIKLVITIVMPAVLFISGAAYFLHAARFHMKDPTIHLDMDERPQLQTKKGCDANAKKLVKEIKREVRLNHKEALVQQREEIHKVGKELETAQRQGLRRILNEVRQGHRTTRRAIRSSAGARVIPP